MSYKDPEKQRQYQTDYYQKNKVKFRKRLRKRRIITRKWIEEYKKNSACKECGENHVAVLDFHHYKGDKDRTISDMVKSCFDIEKIKKEIAKCQVLCANCHRKLHYQHPVQ